MLIGGDEIQLISHTGTIDHLGSHVGGNSDQNVKRNFSFIIGADDVLVMIRHFDVEVSFEKDVFPLEHIAKYSGCSRSGESTRKGCDEYQFDIISQTALVKMPIRQEKKLKRGDRAFDRHLDHVQHEASALPVL